MSRAVVILAQQRAVKEAKAQLRDRGLKPQHYSHREIVALAEEYLAQHREELIKEAKETILRWQAGGMFGPRGGASLQDPDREGREAPSSWLRRERKYASQPFAPITIPEGASFKDMVALKSKSDIGDQINKKIIAPLAIANQQLSQSDFDQLRTSNPIESVFATVRQRTSQQV